MARRGIPLVASMVLIALLLFAFTHFLVYPHISTYGVPASINLAGSSDDSVHAVERLFKNAKAAHDAMLKRQSATYEQAVAVYAAKYSRQPPPGLSRWFELAQTWDSPIVDDFDDIDLQLRPFRPYLRNSCDLQKYTNDECTDRKIIQLCFEDGKVRQYGWREKWHEDTLHAMVGAFQDEMPNMCVYINYLDEPRLLLAPAAADEAANIPVENRICYALNFINIGHQNAWSEATMPCPMDAPARIRPTTRAKPDRELTFAQNFSVATDLCQMERSTAQGMLRSSESLRVSHDIVPVLSSSKLSTFSDVLLPPPFRVSSAAQSEYDPEQDFPWKGKLPKLHWRGSTTGGRGIKNNWKSFHRQHLVKSLSDKHNDAIDVAFTALTQCEEKACDAQSAYFDLANRTDINENWKYKWILDIDGNGLSGRLYDLLRSKSLVFRYTFSREWHDQRLRPWLHYIPLSKDFDEVDELLKFFSTPRGDEIAREMAQAGRDWVSRAMRPEDMTLYLYRLLLEMSSGRDAG